MFIVEEVEAGWEDAGKQRTDVARQVASGSTAENCLRGLVNALNEDEIDTDNCYLEVSEVEL